MSIIGDVNNAVPFKLPETAANLIKSHNDAKQQEGQTIRDHSWMSFLNDHPLAKIDPPNSVRAVALLSGRPFIDRTDYQHADSAEGMNYFLHFFDELLKLKEQNPDAFAKYKFASQWDRIAKFHTELEHAAKWQTEIRELTQNGMDKNEAQRSHLVNQYAEKLKKEFTDKKTAWFPCEIVQDGKPITVMMKIDLTKGAIAIVNTSESAKKYHPSITVTSVDPLTKQLKEQIKYQEFVKISEIDKEQLNHIDFFRFLVESQTRKVWNTPSNKILNEVQIYESLTTFLGGKIEDGVNHQKHPEFYKSVENCDYNSMKTMSTLLHYMMTENAYSNKDETRLNERNAGYKQLQFLMQSHALVGLCKHRAIQYRLNKNNLAAIMTKRDLQLLEDMVEHLSRNADKLYQSKLLDKDNLDGFLSTAQDIQKLLADFKTKQDEIPTTNPVACNLDQAPPADTGNIDFSKKFVGANADDPELNPVVARRTPLEACFENLWIKNFDFGKDGRSMAKGLRDLKNDISKACREMRELEERGQINQDQIKAAGTVLVDKLAQVICKLPDPSHEKNSIWKKIPEKHVLGCMQEVHELMRLVHGINIFRESGANNFNWNWDGGNRHKHEADIAVILYALHTINIQLAQNSEKNRLAGFKFSHHDLIAEVKSPQFVIRNAPLQMKLQSIIAYFDPKFNLESQVTKTDKADRSEYLFEFTENGVSGQYEKANATLKFYNQFIEDISPDSELGKKLYSTARSPDGFTPYGGQISYYEDYFNEQSQRVESRHIRRIVKPGDSTLQHLEALANDRNRGTNREFLPRQVYILQDSTLLCKMLHAGRYQTRQFNQEFTTSAQVSGVTGIRINTESNEWNWQNIYNTSSDIQDTNLEVQIEAQQVYDWYNDGREVGNLVYDLTQRKKQNDFIPEQKKLFKLEVDASRELQMIGIDPYSAIGRLVSFGKRNTYLLKDPKVLDYFRLHLFRNGQLLSQVEDHPGIVSSLARFFYEAIHNYKELGDLKTCLALAKLGNDVQVFINQYCINQNKKEKKDIPWTFVDDDEKKVVNFRKILREELVREVDDNDKLSMQHKWQAKRQIYETLVSFYDKVETNIFLVDKTVQSEAAVDMLGLLITQNLEGQAVMQSSDIMSVLLRLKPVINNDVLIDGSAIGKSRRDQIFNNLIKIINPAYRAAKSWEGGPRIFRNADYSIDVEEGIVFHTDTRKEVGSVPAAILNHDHFRTIFTGKIVTCKNNGNSSYVINEGMENELRVFDTYDGNLGFERVINKEVHRYIPMPHRITQDAPTLNLPGLCCWVCDNTNSMVVLKEDKEVYKAQLTPQGNQAGPNQSYSISKLTRINDQKRTLQWVPQNCAATLLAQLLGLPNGIQIGNINNAECWVDDNTQQLAEIKCADLGLNFTVKNINGQTRLFSQQHPGYYVVDNPQITLLNGLKFFTLKNAAGETKVLIPRNHIEKNDFTGQVYQTLNAPLSWLDFDLKNECLNTKSNEGRFALITLYAALGHYNEAFDLMKKTNSLERFVDNPQAGVMERSVIKNLALNLFKDNHPASQAMLMQLVVMVEQNRLKYPSHQSDDNPQFYLPEEAVRAAGGKFLVFYACYERYKSKASNSTIYRLTDKQEKAFIQLIEDSVDGEVIPNQGGLEILAKVQKTAMKFAIRHFMLRGNRVDFLREGITKLGSKIQTKFDFTLLSNLGSIFAPSLQISDFRRLFDEYNQNELAANITSSVIVNENYFQNNFFGLYHLVRSGTEDERKQIVRLIKLNKNQKCRYAETLELISSKPGNCPTVEEIKKAYKDIDEKTIAKDKARAKEDAAENRYYQLPNGYDWMTGKTDPVAAKARNDARLKMKKAQEKRVKAQKALDNALAFRDNLMEKMCYQITLLQKVKMIWNVVKTILLSGFSVTDRIRDLFYTQFKARKYAAPKEGSAQPTALNIDGKVLKDADTAFETYFNGLLTGYFDANPEKISRNGNNLPVKPKKADKNLEAKLKEQNNDLKYYRASLPDTKDIYTLKGGKTLDQLQGALQKTSNDLNKQLKVQKVALLWQVNQVPDGAAHKKYKNLHKMGQHDILNWDDIRQLSLKGSLEEFRAKTYLDEEEAKKFMLGVSDYLIKASRYDQMKTILKELDKAIKAPDAKKGLFIQNVAEGLKIIRTYEPDATNLHRQWFEVANHYLYRGDPLDKNAGQLKKLKDIYDADLAEMPPGWGKTKTGVPSLNYDKARDGKLVINTWPASLEMTNAVDVKEQMETSYGRKVDRFSFDRSSQFTAASLKLLYEELVTDRKEGRPLNTRSESLRSLELHFLLSLKLANKNEGNVEDLKEMIGWFIKILREIRCYGWSTIDESHITLDPKDKLIYTVGSSTRLTTKQSDVLEECFQELLKEPLASKVNIRDNQQSYLSEEDYDNEIAPVLTEHFRKKFKVSKENKDSFKNFVLGKTEDIPNWLERHKEKEQIGLVKGLLMLVLKASFKGSVDENFGLSKMHINQKEYAIAFASADTPKETAYNPSQFKNPHETIAKTFMTYLHKGLSENQVKVLIEKLQEQADEEAKEGGSLTSTKANKFFKKIAPGCPRGLKALKPEDMKELVPVLKDNMDAIFYYIRYQITPQLKIYSDVLVSTVHNFRTQFSSSLSLSATPQASASLGLDTQFVPMRGTSGRMTHLLLTKCKDPAKLHSLVATQPAKALNEAVDLSNDNPNVKAIIDIGAHTKGLSNFAVAEKMRENAQGNPDIQAIIFFDEKEGLFKIMDAATGHVQDSADSQFDQEACQAFYDQSRCFGSDLKLAVDAVGLLMTGKKTTLAEAVQAAGRLRQLQKQQSVDVVYPVKLEQEIFEGKAKDIKLMIMYWLANQVRQEEESNYRSQEQQMDNEIRRSLLDKILGLEIGNTRPVNKEPDVNEAIRMLGRFENAFFDTESSDPWTMYSKIFPGKESKECLKAAQKSCVKRVTKLSGLSRKEKGILYERLEAYPAVWPKIALPATVIGGPSDLGMECEVLQEQEVNIEEHEVAQIKESLLKREPVKWSEKLDLFSGSWVKPQKHSLFLSNVAAKLAKVSNWMTGKGDPSSRHFAIIRNSVIGMIAGATIGTIFVSIAATSTLALPIIIGVGLLAAGGVLFAGYGSTLVNSAIRFTGQTPVFRMRDLTKARLPSNIAKGADFFNANLLASNNFYKQTTKGVFEEKQQPFNAEQKPIFEVLVIQDEYENGKKDLKLMLIDQNDSVFFHRKLKADRENDKITDDQLKERKRTLAIYDIHNGAIVSQGKNGFKDEDLENSAAFQDLKAQVKFLNGEINYTKTELEKIKSKAEKIGLGAVGSMFEKHILAQHPLNSKFLKHKGIAEALALTAM